MQTINSLISELISDLNSRQKTVLQKRFCLDGKGKKGLTLAELGKKYDVTRERIRQIEEAAFNGVRKKIAEGVGKEFWNYLKSYFDGVGSVRKEADILRETEEYFKMKLTMPQLRFLLESAGRLEIYSEDKDFHSFWHEGAKPLQLAKAVIERTERHFSANKEQMLAEKNIDTVLPVIAKELSVNDMVALNYLTISKKFGTNRYGEFGLAEWPEINPKTVRDRAYLVLRDLRKPLHFRDIASLIKDRKFDEKMVHSSTVHNELIKDGRFVLVGRGIYALKEHGFTPGTAREVISRILKSAGPLQPAELVKMVSKERIFKENTIILNLQNKKLFRRLDDGRYHVNQV